MRNKILLIAATLWASWLGMQAFHELGHVLGAWATGGVVQRVVLDPRTFSRTDLAANPHPLVVVWSGPLLGSVLPLLVLALAAKLHWRDAFLLRFFAGFCLATNGAYVGGGSFARVEDAGEMLRLGSPIWVLWLFGAAALALGIRLWHGERRRWSEPVCVRFAVAAATAAAAWTLLALVLFPA